MMPITRPPSATSITELVSALACDVVAGLSLLYDYVAPSAFSVSVFLVQNSYLVLCAFT